MAMLAITEPVAPPTTVGLVTFNIRYANPGDGPNAWPHRRDMVAAIIDDPRLDVVGLQEALRPQLDDLRARLPGWSESGVGRDDGREAGEYSPVLYRSDRWTAGRTGTFWLSESPERPGSMSWGTACTRVCTWARLERRGGGVPRVLWVFNTHLDHVSSRARVEGVKLIAARIAARGDDEPFVLTGDFNAGEADGAVTFLTGAGGAGAAGRPALDAPPSATGSSTPKASEGVGGAPPAAGDPPPAAAAGASPLPRLVDTFRAVHPDETVVGTFNNFDASKTRGDKIDYVLALPPPRGPKVVEAWIDRRAKEGRTPSDHFPVGAVLEFRAE